jgi:hypothetical protein
MELCRRNCSSRLQLTQQQVPGTGTGICKLVVGLYMVRGLQKFILIYVTERMVKRYHKSGASYPELEVTLDDWGSATPQDLPPATLVSGNP